MKSIAGAWLLRSGLYPKLFGDHAVIVAVHRIDDRYPENPISDPIEGFHRFCEFLVKHFTVVPLSQLLDDLKDGGSIFRARSR